MGQAIDGPGRVALVSGGSRGIGAFHAMVRDQRYDVCELALATFLQAREAGKPLLLLPVVTP